MNNFDQQSAEYSQSPEDAPRAAARELQAKRLKGGAIAHQAHRSFFPNDPVYSPIIDQQSQPSTQVETVALVSTDVVEVDELAALRARAQEAYEYDIQKAA